MSAFQIAEENAVCYISSEDVTKISVFLATEIKYSFLIFLMHPNLCLNYAMVFHLQHSSLLHRKYCFSWTIIGSWKESSLIVIIFRAIINRRTAPNIYCCVISYCTKCSSKTHVRISAYSIISHSLCSNKLIHIILAACVCVSPPGKIRPTY